MLLVHAWCVNPLIATHCGAGSTPLFTDLARKSGEVGLEVLEEGGTALDAVVEAIVVLEDDKRTNAGTGSRLRLNKVVEMDASLMDSDLNCGAVAAIREVKNPIRVAKEVMRTPHILLVGDGAIAFARKKGFPSYDPLTKEAVRRYDWARKKLQEGDLPEWASKWRGFDQYETVGAVAMDKNGKFASGSSTGGTTFMLGGRVGDTPIIGSGIYAGRVGAVSATGIGEEIVRKVLSKHVYDLIQEGEGLQKACDEGVSLFDEVYSVGLIAVTRDGCAASSNREMAWWASDRSL